MMSLPFKKSRDWVNRAAQRVEDAPARLFTRDRPVTASAKREIYEKGIAGLALVIKAPGETFVDPTKESTGPFTIEVELPGRDPFQVELWHSFDREEWERLQPGTQARCRVDPENPQRVLLLPPQPDQPVDGHARAPEPRQQGSAATAVAAGKPAVGTVTSAELTQIANPSEREGRIWRITMELRSESERKPWDVTIYQRVPPGAEELLTAGSELTVGYAKRKSDRDVAIDWPGSTGGRYS
jgi:hypothetical protein